jgi:hypothetical protein
MKRQAISTLPSPILAKVQMPEYLRDLWKKGTLQQMSFYMNYIYTQDRLPLTVPYVILKGTSVAQYYPHPEYRTMGDIDIMTHRENFDAAFHELLADGYKVTKTLEREVTFVKNNIVIELHRYFASLNNPAQCKYLDDLIIKNINPSHILPDLINGLVILEHISQHLEHGLGLRQIIDWMMFVDKCLPDEKWPDFRIMVKKIGLEKLAIITTRMCEIYLGLPERQWCAGEDRSLCDDLMNLILSSGNFGNKWITDEAIAKTVFTYTRGMTASVKWLQERGLANWKAAKKHPILRPFAWIYQGFRYITKGVGQEEGIAKLKAEYKEARRRTFLFEALGVKQKAKGLVTYRNGKYIKN